MLLTLGVIFRTIFTQIKWLPFGPTEISFQDYDPGRAERRDVREAEALSASQTSRRSPRSGSCPGRTDQKSSLSCIPREKKGYVLWYRQMFDWFWQLIVVITVINRCSGPGRTGMWITHKSIHSVFVNRNYRLRFWIIVHASHLD